MKNFFCYTCLFFITLILNGCSQNNTIKSKKLFEKGISKELADYRASALENISFDLLFNIPKDKSKEIQSRTSISLDINNLSNPLILDFRAQPEQIKNLLLNGEKISYSFEKEHIIISKSLLNNGKNTITIESVCGNSSLNRRDEFMYSLFVPANASSAFPCFDQPDIKAQYSVTLNIPQEWESVSNGIPNVVEKKDNGTKTVFYTRTKPIPSYLLAFAAGNFKREERKINGRTFRLFHREFDEKKVRQNIDEIFNLHAQAYEWMEEYTGIKFPFQDYEFCVIPSFQFGGMEHPGSIWYSDKRFFLEENPTRDQELNRAQLISHEVSHMWFGDLVTMKWFDDVWLKEVFANFMADKIVRPSFPDFNHDLLFISSHYPKAYSVDRTKGTHPIQQPLDNLSDAGSLYGTIIYHKAPIVMKHLEMMISEKTLQEGLRAYLKKFYMGNATWDDLINILSEKSNQDLSLWNNNWVKSPGMPHFKTKKIVQNNTSLDAIEIEQISENTYQQKLHVELTNTNQKTQKYLVNTNSKKTALKTSLNYIPKFINLFGSNYEYGYQQMTDEEIEWLLRNINNEKNSTKRYVQWINLWENFLNARIAPEKIQKVLFKSVSDEPNSRILNYTLGLCKRMNSKFYTTKQTQQFEKILINRLNKTKELGEKRMIWNAFVDISSDKSSLDYLYSIWNGTKKESRINLSENDLTRIATTLILKKYPKWSDILEQHTKKINNPDKKNKFKYLKTALSNNLSEQKKFFELLKNKKERRNETWIETGISYLHHPLRTHNSEQFILPTLELLEDIKRTGSIFFPGRLLNYSFYAHDSESAISIVNQFLDNHPNYPIILKNKILQSSDMMHRFNKIKKKYKK